MALESLKKPQLFTLTCYVRERTEGLGKYSDNQKSVTNYLFLVNSILNFNNRTKVAGHLSISTLNINLVLVSAPKVHRVIGWY